jgi:signal transduction histidine kinase/ActR/RegA family two-component response regulator
MSNGSDRPAEEDFMQAAARGEAAPPSGKLRHLAGVRADGRGFPIEASLSTLPTDAGLLITIVFRDITEQQLARAEQQKREALEASSRAKTDFLSRMSHELRTPLNAVLGFSQLLRLDADQPPSLRQLERIEHIENAGSHLLALVNDVLDLSRVEAGQMTVRQEPVDARNVIADAIGMVSSLAAVANVAVSMSRGLARVPVASGDGESGPWVVADPVRLRQVLVNLLSNAVKYNRLGGKVHVGWIEEAGELHFTVADTGPGMTAEKLARLFEPFNRLGAERTKVEGTGIGLALSRRLAELMNGELSVESVIGQGTIATLVLKTSKTPARRPDTHAPPSQHSVFEDCLNVLYAEDDDVNAELVRQVAKFRPAITLRVAHNGADAIRMAQQDPPDLMLLDMNLGDMTGTEVARVMREHPATHGIRLVALSADALPGQITAAIEYGFEHYLTKPIDFRRLLNVFDGKPDIEV